MGCGATSRVTAADDVAGQGKWAAGSATSLVRFKKEQGCPTLLEQRQPLGAAKAGTDAGSSQQLQPASEAELGERPLSDVAAEVDGVDCISEITALPGEEAAASRCPLPICSADEICNDAVQRQDIARRAAAAAITSALGSGNLEKLVASMESAQARLEEVEAQSGSESKPSLQQRGLGHVRFLPSVGTWLHLRKWPATSMSYGNVTNTDVAGVNSSVTRSMPSFGTASGTELPEITGRFHLKPSVGTWLLVKPQGDKKEPMSVEIATLPAETIAMPKDSYVELQTKEASVFAVSTPTAHGDAESLQQVEDVAMVEPEAEQATVAPVAPHLAPKALGQFCFLPSVGGWYRPRATRKSEDHFASRVPESELIVANQEHLHDRDSECRAAFLASDPGSNTANVHDRDSECRLASLASESGSNMTKQEHLHDYYDSPYALPRNHGPKLAPAPPKGSPCGPRRPVRVAKASDLCKSFDTAAAATEFGENATPFMKRTVEVLETAMAAQSSRHSCSKHMVMMTRNLYGPSVRGVGYFHII